MQTYEGYVEDGKFFPIGLMKRTGPRRAFLTVLDEPAPSPAPEKAEAFIEEFQRLGKDAMDEEQFLRAEWLKRLDAAISASLNEELPDFHRSMLMREPIDLSD